jgi:hypothetical protein
LFLATAFFTPHTFARGALPNVAPRRDRSRDVASKPHDLQLSMNCDRPRRLFAGPPTRKAQPRPKSCRSLGHVPDRGTLTAEATLSGLSSQK